MMNGYKTKTYFYSCKECKYEKKVCTPDPNGFKFLLEALNCKQYKAKA